tara:strand:- start:12962 stop:13405 length:444 start_codon:yes stop_codon:yes gene_type:complete
MFAATLARLVVVRAILPENLAFGNRIATFMEKEHLMKIYLSLGLPTHRWLGPMNAIPKEWFEGDRLTLRLQPFGNVAVERAAFVRERMLRSRSEVGLVVFGYEPAVQLKSRWIVAIDHIFEINRLWTRYQRVNISQKRTVAIRRPQG